MALKLRTENTTLGEVVRRYANDILPEPGSPVLRMMGIAGLPGEFTLREIEVMIRTLHCEHLPVELIDAQYGLQVWDPDRKTPIGWIRPSPWRDGSEAEAPDAQE